MKFEFFNMDRSRIIHAYVDCVKGITLTTGKSNLLGFSLDGYEIRPIDSTNIPLINTVINLEILDQISEFAKFHNAFKEYELANPLRTVTMLATSVFKEVSQFSAVNALDQLTDEYSIQSRARCMINSLSTVDELRNFLLIEWVLFYENRHYI